MCIGVFEVNRVVVDMILELVRIAHFPEVLPGSLHILDKNGDMIQMVNLKRKLHMGLNVWIE